MNWRALASCVALVGCATTPIADGPSEHLRGCWVERDEHGVRGFMRWFPDRERPGTWTGHVDTNPRSKAPHGTNVTLTREVEGWRLCGEGRALNTCLPVAFSRNNTLTPPNALLVAEPERLAFEIHYRGREPTLIHAERDGCD